MKYLSMPALILLTCVVGARAQQALPTDKLPTSQGELTVTFIGHGSLAFGFGGHSIQVDPYGKLADYSRFPKADMVVLTHDHPDHLDVEAIEAVRGTNTVILLTARCARQVRGGEVMKNGDVLTVKGIRVEAVPAYNLVHRRDNGEVFHTRGDGNGYVFTFGDRKVYVAGDTENTPEMKALTGIDAAFLPMNLPYTMTPEMVADAAKAFKPRILYPYHYGETDPQRLVALMKDTAGVEVRVRPMK